MQFIPGLDQIWVARLNPEDPIYEFDTLEECTAKAAELQAADETGRQYKASEESAELEIPAEPAEPEVPVESVEPELGATE